MEGRRKRVAVVGGGITGLGAAYELAKAGVNVCLYHKEEQPYSTTINGLQLHLRFIFFNRVTSPNMMELFKNLGIEMEDYDMSFSVSLDKGRGCEWGSRNGLSSVFAQKSNLLNPYFLKMLHEIVRFKDDAFIYLDEAENNPEIHHNETLGNFIKSRGYSELFQTAYLIPMCSSIWSCPSDQVLAFSALSILLFLRNHHLLQLFGRPQCLTVKGGPHCYVDKITKELVDRGCQIRTNCEVQSVSTRNDGCVVSLGDGSVDAYDECILAIDPPEALKVLGQQATHDETRILGAFQYAYSDIFLHRDISLMPRNRAAWSALNFLGSSNSKATLTYWLNVLQNIGEEEQPFLVTLNPSDVPKDVLLKWSARHPLPSVAASTASVEMDNIQGKRGIWFCGAYQGYGFHEDGLKAGMVAAHGLLGRNCILLRNQKQMALTWTETAARAMLCRFLKGFISVGCLIILEDGGGVLTFQGTSEKCAPTVTIRVHNPRFYWMVSTEGDIGLADAYINGDFTLVDKNEGLFNLLTVFIANKELKSCDSRPNTKRGWWTPMLFTAAKASAKYFYPKLSRQNARTQARRNVTGHYDLSNDLFSLFLDDTMTYSCAVFKSINEDLREAQLRKIRLLIKKARIEKHHEVLEIGCGWGSLAIEVVRLTGCRYTGITPSKESLRFVEERVKEAGLQDRIKFLLCGYRRLPREKKYDRIISCEMIEAVGHEHMQEFFHCCDSVLANNGLLVLQFVSVPDARYDENRQSSDFIKEYIFPGECLPSLSRVASTMANASRLCIEHIENIGIHYCQTQRCWRRNFLEKRREIMSLGFDEKFIRTWEYYFDYSAASFRTRTLGDYQVVFSRPGNDTAFGDPYEGLPSFSSCLMEDSPIKST